jgi:hypothetical protein
LGRSDFRGISGKWYLPFIGFHLGLKHIFQRGAGNEKNIPAEWENEDTRHVAVGAQYPLTSNWIISGGQAYERSPVNCQDRTVLGAYNIFFSLAEKMVLAYRLYGRFIAGRVPLYDLFYFDSHNDLRGYAAGQYVDKSMIATQLEFR